MLKSDQEKKVNFTSQIMTLDDYLSETSILLEKENLGGFSIPEGIDPPDESGFWEDAYHDDVLPYNAVKGYLKMIGKLQ